MSRPVVRVRKETGFEDLPIPARHSPHASGFDLHAAVDEPMVLKPGSVALVSAGFRLSIPEGIEAQVRPRSGLALKHGIGILNSPGTIDADYRGIVGVVLFNFGKEDFTIRRGDRIAQMVFVKVENADLQESKTLGESSRGASGFGSTGK